MFTNKQNGDSHELYELLGDEGEKRISRTKGEEKFLNKSKLLLLINTHKSMYLYIKCKRHLAFSLSIKITKKKKKIINKPIYDLWFYDLSVYGAPPYYV